MPGHGERPRRALFHCPMSCQSQGGKEQSITSEMLTKVLEISRNACPTQLCWERLKQSDILPSLHSSAFIARNWCRFLPSAISHPSNATKDTDSHRAGGARNSLGH